MLSPQIRCLSFSVVSLFFHSLFQFIHVWGISLLYSQGIVPIFYLCSCSILRLCLESPFSTVLDSFVMVTYSTLLQSTISFWCSMITTRNESTIPEGLKEKAFYLASAHYHWHEYSLKSWLANQSVSSLGKTEHERFNIYLKYWTFFTTVGMKQGFQGIRTFVKYPLIN